MDTQELDQLAARLCRPSRSLQAFSGLAPEQLAMLGQWVEEACEQRRQNLDTALRAALPAPLRWLVLWALRGRGA